MKKVGLFFSFIMGLAAFVYIAHLHAGVPQDQGLNLSGKFYHTVVQGSTNTAGAIPIQLAIAAPSSSNSGGQTIQYQNCFTRFVVQLSSVGWFAVYDGATTTVPVTWIWGSALGSGASNTISLPEDHLGPLCTSLGNATTIVVSTGSQGAVTTNNEAVSYEGYSTAGAGSISN